MALILDTGVLLAALDEADADHEACADLIGSSQEELVIPSPVMVELDYWIGKLASPDAWLTFCEDVHGGAYILYPLHRDGLLAAAQLQVKYADLRLGLVDATVFVACGELGERKVATLDRRHFSVLRTDAGDALQIVPE